jgi:hypothetical protein
MPQVGFEPTVSVDERSQTYATDRAASGTGFGFVGGVFPVRSLAGSPCMGLLTENIRDFNQPSLPNAGILPYCAKTTCF